MTAEDYKIVSGIRVTEAFASPQAFASTWDQISRKPKSEIFKYEVQEATPGLSGAIFTDDIDLLMGEVLNRQIITQIEDVRVGRQCVPIIQVSGSIESWLKEYGFEANRVEQGAEIPIAKLRHAKVHLELRKWGVRAVATYEAIADNQFGMFERHINQAVVAMARYEDKHIMTTLNAGVPDGSSITGTKETNHTFASPDTNLTWDLFVKAYMSIKNEGLNPKKAIFHPYQAAQMLRLEEYRNMTSGHGEFVVMDGNIRKVMESGQLPGVLGLDFLVTANQTAGKILMLDDANYGIYAERQPLLTESDTDIVRQVKTTAMTQRGGCGIINNDGGAHLTNLKLSL